MEPALEVQERHPADDTRGLDDLLGTPMDSEMAEEHDALGV
jgi:hypothetical protein